MNISRRHLVKSLAVTAVPGGALEAADSTITVEALDNVSAFDGSNLSAERLRVLKPVLENRLAQLRPLRDIEINDAVEPTHGCI